MPELNVPGLTGPELTIPTQLNGPPDTANGGVTAGLLAGYLPSGATIQVTLRRPPPLGRALLVEVDVTTAKLLAGDELIAAAGLVDAEAAGPAVPPVSPEQAREASTRFDGLADHPFPTCFVCGTARPAHDGLAVFAGPTDPGGSDQHAVAAAFSVGAAHLPPRFPAGDVLAWAALDCPSGWAIGLPGRPAVLGRMVARVQRVPQLGEECVVVAQLDHWDGRKAFSASTLYGADGAECARATSVWIELRGGPTRRRS